MEKRTHDCGAPGDRCASDNIDSKTGLDFEQAPVEGEHRELDGRDTQCVEYLAHIDVLQEPYDLEWVGDFGDVKA